MSHTERIKSMYLEMWVRAKEDLIVQSGGQTPTPTEVGDHVMQTQILALGLMLLPTDQDQVDFYNVVLDILKGGKAKFSA